MSALSAGWADARLCRSTCFSKRWLLQLLPHVAPVSNFSPSTRPAQSLEGTEHAHISPLPNSSLEPTAPPVFPASTKHHVRGAPILIIITGPSTPPFLSHSFFFLLPHPILLQLPLPPSLRHARFLQSSTSSRQRPNSLLCRSSQDSAITRIPLPGFPREKSSSAVCCCASFPKPTAHAHFLVRHTTYDERTDENSLLAISNNNEHIDSLIRLVLERLFPFFLFSDLAPGWKVLVGTPEPTNRHSRVSIIVLVSSRLHPGRTPLQPDTHNGFVPRPISDTPVAHSCYSWLILTTRRD